MTRPVLLVMALVLPISWSVADEPKARLVADRPPQLKRLADAKSAYEAVAEAHKKAVLALYQEAEDRAFTTGNTKLKDAVTAERKKFLYDRAESRLFESKLVAVKPLVEKLGASQRAVTEAYRAAHGYYIEKKLKAEAVVLKEEMDEFAVLASGRPRLFHDIDQALRAEEYAPPGRKGPKVSLLTLLGRVGRDPSLKLLNKAPQLWASNAQREMDYFLIMLDKKDAKLGALEKAWENARDAVEQATNVGKGDVQRIMKDVHAALTAPPESAAKKK